MNTQSKTVRIPKSLRVGAVNQKWYAIRRMKSGALLRGAFSSEHKDEIVTYAKQIASDSEVERAWILLVESKVLKEESI